MKKLAVFALLIALPVIANQLDPITTFAGNGAVGFGGDGGPATSASFYDPSEVTVDSVGNVYVVDANNERIRRIDLFGTITTVAGNGDCAFAGDGGPATSASFCYPTSVAVDASGNLYISDLNNQRVRRVDGSTGVITTVAGNGASGYSGDGVPATSASLWNPYGVAVYGGSFYVAEIGGNRVRRVDPAGIITTIAGNGASSYSGDGGPATAAGLNGPSGIAFDAAGNLFIADQANSAVRRVDAATGIITTVAGNGAPGFSGDGGPAAQATLNAPEDVAVDEKGNLFIADSTNERIRRVDAASGTITTVAGNGAPGFSGDGGPAVSASLNIPTGVAVGRYGRLYIADMMNYRIRRVLMQVDTSTAVSSTKNPSTYGELLYLNATVTPPYAAGALEFFDGSTSLARFYVTTGSASWPASFLGAGSHSITAVFTGDTGFLNSTSPTLAQTINKASTSTTAGTSNNVVNPGDPVTLRASVLPSAATGNVQFFDGSTSLGTSTLSNGSTSLTVTLASGTHPISEVYLGDANYSGSTSLTFPEIVNSPTSTTIASSPNPSSFNQAVTLTATLSPSSAPNGIQFYDGNTALGTALPTNGTATLTVSSLSVGSHSLRAAYSGAIGFLPSSSPTLTQTVNRAATTTMLASSLNPSNSGESVTFSATVTSAGALNAPITGTVQFKDGSTLLGTTTLSSGLASFTTSNLSVATHSITASYTGDSNYNPSASPVLSQVVNRKKR